MPKSPSLNTLLKDLDSDDLRNVIKELCKLNPKNRQFLELHILGWSSAHADRVAEEGKKKIYSHLYGNYKYPDSSSGTEKLKKFFGEENIPAIVTDRINNEYSHLSGVFERGSTPVEVPEMKSVAEQIIEKLKEDKEQFNSFHKSIGVDKQEENTA